MLPTQVRLQLGGRGSAASAARTESLEAAGTARQDLSGGVSSRGRLEASIAASALSPLTEIGISDSDEYDTDLGEDALRPSKGAAAGVKKPELDEEEEEEGAAGGAEARAYRAVCEAEGVAAQSSVPAMLTAPTLALPHRSLSPPHVKALATVLLNNHSVSTVDLEDIGMTPEGAAHLADLVIHNTRITHLNLSNNKLGEQGAVAVGAILRYCRGVTKLNAAGNNFTELGAPYLVHGLKTNVDMVELDLSHNEFGEAGAKFLGRAIAENCGLKQLNLSWNHFRCKGAVSICKGIQNNQCLHEVDLSWNGLGYEGALAFRDLLKVNETLQEVDVSNNRVNWQGALLVAAGLRNNMTLKTLKIGHNPLTTTGCMDLIEACAEDGCGLLTLDLQGVPVISEFELMAMAIRQTRAFQHQHGGVVNSHDILGQRFDKRLGPMQKVINYMKARELRPTELFRSFDKQVAKQITHDDLITRLKKAGVEMPRHEYIELIHIIQSQENGSADINYKKMVRSVHDQIEKERLGKIRERERERRLQEYHRELLTTDLPPVPELFTALPEQPEEDREEEEEEGELVEGVRALSASERSVAGPGKVRPGLGMVAAALKGAESGVLQATPRPPSSRCLAAAGGGAAPGVMSMATPLGSKPKAFGHAQPKTKKKKKKKKAAKRK